MTKLYLLHHKRQQPNLNSLFRYTLPSLAIDLDIRLLEHTNTRGVGRLNNCRRGIGICILFSIQVDRPRAQQGDCSRSQQHICSKII